MSVERYVDILPEVQEAVAETGRSSRWKAPS